MSRLLDEPGPGRERRPLKANAWGLWDATAGRDAAGVRCGAMAGTSGVRCLHHGTQATGLVVAHGLGFGRFATALAARATQHMDVQPLRTQDA